MKAKLCGGQCVIRKQDLLCDWGFREVKLLHTRNVGFRGTDRNVKYWPSPGQNNNKAKGKQKKSKLTIRSGNEKNYEI